MNRQTIQPEANFAEKLPRVVPDGGNLDGTQAIRRAVQVLRIVASYRRPGASLANIAEAMQLSRSTAHRILKCLVQEELLAVDDLNHRFTIGRLAYELSLSDLNDHHSAAFWGAVLPIVARKTGHTTYLMARTGGESVCLQRADGHAVVRVSPVEIGQRRPLGVGGGGIALLAAFDEDEIRHFVDSIGTALNPFTEITPDRLFEDAMSAKKRGYAISKGRVFPEVLGIAVTIPGSRRPRLAISVTAPVGAVTEGGIEDVVEIMRQEIAVMLA